LKEEALDRIKWRNRFGRGCEPVVWQITDDDDVFNINQPLLTEYFITSKTINKIHYLSGSHTYKKINAKNTVKWKQNEIILTFM
jgi:hypothetical protein